MPVIKYDITGSDPERAKAGTFEQPKPGVYTCRIKAMNPGFSKNSDGSPDKTRPRIEVIYEIVGKPYGGTQLWEYLTFGESAIWKLDQFLMAVGIASEKSKRKGSFDTAKLIGKNVKIRVRAGKNLTGEYRAEVGSVFPADADVGGSAMDANDMLSPDEDEDVDEMELAEDISEAEPEEEESEPEEDDDELLEDDDDELLEEESEPEPEPEPEEDRLTQLEAMTVADLKAEAAALEISVTGLKKSQVIEAIIAAEGEAVEDEDEEDIVLDDEEEETLDPNKYLTRDQLSRMTPKELVKLARNDFDLTVQAGIKRGALIDAILEAQGAPSEDGEDPF